MNVRLVTFASADMIRSQEECEMSALRHGVTRFTHWSQNESRQTEWYKANQGLLNQPRGCGFWAWKPWAILAEIAIRAQLNDVVVYSDVGIEFVAPVQHIIDRMGHDRPQDDVWLFGNNWEHAHWCKGDVLFELWRDARVRNGLDAPEREYIPSGPNSRHYGWNISDMEMLWQRHGKQCQASVIFFRVSDYSREFVAEWLKWCLHDGGRLIDDSPSVAPNHPEFREHRHDQAILTTLAYREGIPLHWWPGVYLPDDRVYEKLPCYADDTYPPLFRHHRRRDHEWPDAGVARYHCRTLRGFKED